MSDNSASELCVHLAECASGTCFVNRIVACPHQPEWFLLIGGSSSADYAVIWDAARDVVVRDLSHAFLSSYVLCAAFHPFPRSAAAAAGGGECAFALVAVNQSKFSTDSDFHGRVVAFGLEAIGIVDDLEAAAVAGSATSTTAASAIRPRQAKQKKYDFLMANIRSISSVNSVEFMPNGEIFAVCTNNKIFFFSCATAKIADSALFQYDMEFSSPIPGTRNFFTMKFSPDSLMLAVGGSDSVVDIVSVAHGPLGSRKTINVKNQFISTLCWSLDARYLFVYSMTRRNSGCIFCYAAYDDFVLVQKIELSRDLPRRVAGRLGNVDRIFCRVGSSCFSTHHIPTSANSMEGTAVREWSPQLGKEMINEKLNSVLGCKAAISCDGRFLVVVDVKQPDKVRSFRI